MLTCQGRSLCISFQRPCGDRKGPPGVCEMRGGSHRKREPSVGPLAGPVMRTKDTSHLDHLASSLPRSPGKWAPRTPGLRETGRPCSRHPPTGGQSGRTVLTRGRQAHQQFPGPTTVPRGLEGPLSWGLTSHLGPHDGAAPLKTHLQASEQKKTPEITHMSGADCVLPTLQRKVLRAEQSFRGRPTVGPAGPPTGRGREPGHRGRSAGSRARCTLGPEPTTLRQEASVRRLRARRFIPSAQRAPGCRMWSGQGGREGRDP